MYGDGRFQTAGPQLNPGQGYWIHLRQIDDVSIGTTQVAANQIPAYWNMIWGLTGDDDDGDSLSDLDEFRNATYSSDWFLFVDP